jgi:hypothetical protein
MRKSRYAAHVGKDVKIISWSLKMVWKQWTGNPKICGSNPSRGSLIFLCYMLSFVIDMCPPGRGVRNRYVSSWQRCPSAKGGSTVFLAHPFSHLGELLESHVLHEHRVPGPFHRDLWKREKLYKTYTTTRLFMPLSLGEVPLYLKLGHKMLLQAKVLNCWAVSLCWFSLLQIWIRHDQPSWNITTKQVPQWHHLMMLLWRVNPAHHHHQKRRNPQKHLQLYQLGLTRLNQL